MYHPYLRGKQFELILLRDNAKFLANNNIHPIIEPVKNDFKALIRAINILNQENTNCTLIINPQAGSEPVKESKIEELIDNNFINFNNVSIGYILYAGAELSNLVVLLEKYKTFNFSIIHYGFTNGKELAGVINNFKNIGRHIFIDGYTGKLYQKNFKKIGIPRILLRNGFKSQKKNSLYPLKEHFSDLHITYDEEGMDGFGDFLIVGDDYSETGGPAYAIAIHLTYFNNDDDMFIYHFLSVQTDSPTDPGGKFFEALKKLVDTVNDEDSLIFRSKACNEYIELFRKQHYPGLGYAKKLSMQHHIELIANFLNQK